MPGCRGAAVWRSGGAWFPTLPGCGLLTSDFGLSVVDCGLRGLRRGAEAEGAKVCGPGVRLRLWTLAVGTLAVGHWRAGVEHR